MNIQRWNISLQKVGNGEYKHMARRAKNGAFVLYDDHCAAMQAAYDAADVEGLVRAFKILEAAANYSTIFEWTTPDLEDRIISDAQADMAARNDPE